ncbi:MAG: hypothetical protein IKQ87_00950 [Clostridia bacterium]|nr:hypothetical protein [Clostridia bacterium]
MKQYIFAAERDGDAPIVGTSRKVAQTLGLNPFYLRDRVRTNARGRTRDGWLLRQLMPGEPPPAAKPARIFRAENPREDPIEGPAEEIAALTGLRRGFVYDLAETGRASFKGWTVREIGEVPEK